MKDFVLSARAESQADRSSIHKALSAGRFADKVVFIALFVRHLTRGQGRGAGRGPRDARAAAAIVGETAQVTAADRDKLLSFTKVKDITYTVKKLKWDWVDHMIRRKKKKWIKEVTVWCPRDSKRRKGRKKVRWEDDIKKVAGIIWQRNAENNKIGKTLWEACAKGQADNVTDVEE
ncbi:hypothetical protein EVAR_65568_1 [Eumeta japonica]|uniref:Endonuclease-reverse transcriptase n=1 Tax=Eumeta variegata TaxID=151549 RepID=A0A4C1ZBB6_EUMVA|nr:hypothetical protein EVAR_65568_1 [Eumeta japonica]